jgi:hypothetical protein
MAIPVRLAVLGIIQPPVDLVTHQEEVLAILPTPLIATTTAVSMPAISQVRAIQPLVVSVTHQLADSVTHQPVDLVIPQPEALATRVTQLIATMTVVSTPAILPVRDIQPLEVLVTRQQEALDTPPEVSATQPTLRTATMTAASMPAI